MISFSDQECEIFTGKINRPLCDMLCAAPEFLHNGFNFFFKYFYAPMICKNVVLNRLLCYRRAKVKVEFMQESIYFEFQDRILLCQCYWVVCTHNKNIYLQKFSFKSKKKASLSVNIQTWFGFYVISWREKEAFKLGLSLSLLNYLVKQDFLQK